MIISVETFNGKTINLEVQPTDTISSIKSIIEGEDNIPSDQQRLIYAKQKLNSAQTISHYNIKDGSILHLVVHGSMEIYVQRLSQDKIRKRTLVVLPSDRIEIVKDRIQGVMKTPADQQRLAFNGKKLKGHHTLEYYKIVHKDTISLNMENVEAEATPVVPDAPPEPANPAKRTTSTPIQLSQQRRSESTAPSSSTSSPSSSAASSASPALSSASTAPSSAPSASSTPSLSSAKPQEGQRGPKKQHQDNHFPPRPVSYASAQINFPNQPYKVYQLPLLPTPQYKLYNPYTTVGYNQGRSHEYQCPLPLGAQQQHYQQYSHQSYRRPTQSAPQWSPGDLHQHQQHLPSGVGYYA